jgi:hypothetical protein
LSADDVLTFLTNDLRWDFSEALREIQSQYPYLLLDNDDFGAINIIIHERMAGLGDLVFIGNTGQVFSTIFPNKKIRLIFHSEADFKLVCETKILKGLDPDKPRQYTWGMEVINAEVYGKEKALQNKDSFSGVEGMPWYQAQQDIIDENDISIVYALGGTPKEVLQNSYNYRLYAGKSKVTLFIHELGFSSLTRDPLSSGDVHLGFAGNEVGMPPVSPVSERIYAKKYPRETKRIQKERERILEKFPGYELLNDILKQKNLERTIRSEWGFLYAHEGASVRRYFTTFERARNDHPNFREETTFFMMCGQKDKAVIAAAKELAQKFDYNLFVYANDHGVLTNYRRAQSNNVTVIMDFSVPRKLFNELFLYSDDLPTLVSGQDNLANILYLNVLTTGRPFFWEALVFQTTSFLDILIYLQQQMGREDADYLKVLWDTRQVSSGAADMFAAPRQYRYFFKKVSLALNQHVSFVSQMYYLMLRHVNSQRFLAVKRVNKFRQLIDALSTKVSLDINKELLMAPIIVSDGLTIKEPTLIGQSI